MDALFFVGLLFLALVKATPIAFGAMSGLLCERSGVINIAIEGMMLIAAMMAFLGSILFDNLTGGTYPHVVSLLAGLVAAVISAALVALLHAWLSIKYKVDQIISGTVINLLAVGITNFTANAYIDPSRLSGLGVFPEARVPILADIPIIGPLFFTHQPLVYVMLILVVLLQYALFRTPWGLRTRAVGEHPRAADTVGINVISYALHQCDPRGCVGRLGWSFPGARERWSFSKIDDHWARLYCPGCTDFREMDLGWLIGLCPVVRLF